MLLDLRGLQMATAHQNERHGAVVATWLHQPQSRFAEQLRAPSAGKRSVINLHSRPAVIILSCHVSQKMLGLTLSRDIQGTSLADNVLRQQG